MNDQGATKEVLYLLKVGELTLKKGSQAFFERILKKNIRNALEPLRVRITDRNNRMYLTVPEEHAEKTERVLSSTFGLLYFSRALVAEKNMDDILEKCLLAAGRALEDHGGKTFKVESRRTDKSFPLDSYAISREAGAAVLHRYPELTVDVHRPDFRVNIEVREKAYIYGRETACPGGLPVGTAGKGMLLLSGGIDSPVAGYLMAKRGIRLGAVYFHAYPYTSDLAKDKVVQLARLLSPYTGRMRLFVVPFTDIQLRIRELGAEEETTLHMRACMMRIATLLAEKRKAICLVTGESLSQVASQTPQSIRFTGSNTDLPVFRPLIGLDKSEIITIARKIGTFETSILPYEDCCTIFSPRHPLVHPDFQKIRGAYEQLGMEKLLAEAVERAELIEIAPA